MAFEHREVDSTDLFLLGKTGHGKSTTGNSIVGREAFLVSDGAQSETNVVQVGWGRHLGRTIKVVDGPGLCETRLSKGDAAKKMTKDMEQGIMQCPKGFHALVLVLKYGNRFTEEELSTVEMLKSTFGPSFVRDFCIIVFTHGELFDMNNRRTPGKTFPSWCREQQGALQILLEECDYKALLFRNAQTEHADSQRQELLSFVDNLKTGGRRYTSEIFQRAAEAREKIIVRENAPALREKIQAKVSLLQDGIEKVKEKTELTEEVQATFHHLEQDARDLDVEIAAQDKGTGVLDSLKQTVKSVRDSILSHMEALREKSEKEKKEKEFEDAKKKHDEIVANQKKALEEKDTQLAEQLENLKEENNQQVLNLKKELEDASNKQEMALKEAQMKYDASERLLRQEVAKAGEKRMGFFTMVGNFLDSVFGLKEK